MKTRAYYTFIETKLFSKEIDRLASMEVLYALQTELIIDPHRGDVIKGIGGARKARIADKSRKQGKSGSFRYIYLFLEKAGIVYLLHFYEKSRQETLTADEEKILASLVRRIKEIHKE